MHGFNLMHSSFDTIYCYLGESTLHPSKIVIKKIKILHLNFFGTCEHQILDFLAHFKYIALALNLT
jgi:hypothetical protein